MKTSAPILIFVGLLLLLAAPHASLAATTDNLSGYAWSSNVGWVSFNCTNDNSCATNNYGVTVAANGTMTGYAWSPNVGWISFNSADTTGCPSGTCQATLNSTNGTTSGWARAVAGEDPTLADTGSWTGWIHLTSASYGVTVAGCNWSGEAWGGGPDVSTSDIGWLKFSGTGYGVKGTGANSCIGALPDLTSSLPGNIPATVGANTPVSFTISNSNAAATGASFWDTVWFSTTPSITTEFDYKEFNSGIPNGFPAGYSETKTVNQTFTNPGTYYYEVCADQNQNQLGTITESNETNNCSSSNSSWQTVTVAPASCVPTLSLASGAPSTVALGQSTTFNYSEQCAAYSCTLNGATVTGGTATVQPPAPSNGNPDNYALDCTPSTPTPPSPPGPVKSSLPVSITVTVPSVTLTATPTRVSAPSAANAVSLMWTAPLLTDPSNVCTVTGNGNVAPWGTNEPTSSGSTPLVDPKSVTQQTIYQISCTTGTLANPGTPVTSTAVVNIVPVFTNF